MPYSVPVSPGPSYGATQRVQSAPQPVPPPPAQSGYNVYTPGRTGQRDGAAFLPYSSGAVATMDKPSNQKSWLVPVIVGAAVVLLGLAVLSGYLVVAGKNNTSNNSPVSQAPARTPLPANASEEDKIREAIITSNDNQITAWKNLDETLLDQSYTGAALAENKKQVEDLQQRGMYAVPVNESLKVVDVTPQGDKATAHTLEKWTVTYYSKADNRVITKNSYTLSETYHLVKQDGKWLIENLDIQDVTGTPGTGT